MFRFRSIKPEHLHLYEKQPETTLDQLTGVTQKMLDHAECIADLDSTNETEKVYKVFNYDHELTDNKNDGDVEMKDDATTNSSPDMMPISQK